MDLYLPTIRGLEAISNNIVKMDILFLIKEQKINGLRKKQLKSF